jgi:hypothetical protein
MATIAWPSGRLFIPQVLSFGEQRKRRSSGDPPLGGDAQVAEVPYSHRWTMDVTLVPSGQFAQRAQQEAWISRIARGDNRVTSHHHQHPLPYGSARGTQTLSGALAQGATTAVIAGATNGQTYVAGDMIGITTTAAYAVQLVRVTVGGTVAGGTVSVTFEPPLRASANSGAAVVWDRPAALWMLVGGSWKQTSSARNAQPIGLSFIEVLS